MSQPLVAHGLHREAELILNEWQTSILGRPRELNLLFGRIDGHRTLDDAVLSGDADVVLLGREQMDEMLQGASSAECAISAMRGLGAKPLLGVVSFIDEVQDVPAQINRALGWSHTGLVQAARALSDKEAFYLALERCGVVMPSRVQVPCMAALPLALQQLSGALDAYIIKPVTGTESRGVYRPPRGVDVASVVACLRALPDLRADEPLLVMEYIPRGGAVPAREFCVDGFCCDGSIGFHVIHEKVRIFEDYPIHDRLMLTPPREARSSAGVAEILDVLPGIVSADAFVFHLELRDDGTGRPVPIDLSLRPGGGLIYRSVMASCGVDLRMAHSLCCLGMAEELRRLHAHDSARRHVAIGAFFSNGQTRDRLKGRVARLQASGGASGLVACDISRVSILGAGSRLQKPDVGLCVQSATAGDDALAQIDHLAQQLGTSVAPRGAEVAGNRLLAFEFDGPVQLPALQLALAAMGDAHGCLHGCSVDPARRPVIQARVLVTTLARLADDIAAQATHVLDPDGGPLLHAAFIEGASMHGTLVLCLHRSVNLAWAGSTLLHDLGCAYRGACGQAGIRPVPQQVLPASVVPRVPNGLMPTMPGFLADRPRLVEPGCTSDRVRFAVRPTRHQALQALAEEMGVTLQELLWAAWACLLHRHSGMPVVSASMACPAGGPGYLWVTLAMASQQTFRHVVHAARAAMRAAASTSSAEVPALGFVVAPDCHSLDFGLVSGRGIEAPAVASAHELELRFEVGDALHGVLEYRPDLFDRHRIERMAEHITGLLDAVTVDPDQRIASIEFMSATERDRLLTMAGARSGDTGRCGTAVHVQIGARAMLTPDAIAVACDDGEHLSYADLDRRANQIAHCLRSAGVGVGDVVGLFAPPSTLLVAALLAILKAGAAYLPIAHAVPAERVRHILRDASVRVVVTEHDLARSCSLADNCVHVLLLDGDRLRIDAQPVTKLTDTTAPDDLAYVIYTSGSTGKAKGVMVTHGGVANLCSWYAARLDLGPQTRNLVATSLGFDLTQKNISATLCHGGRVVMSKAGPLSGRELREAIDLAAVTVVNCAPSQMLYAFEAGEALAQPAGSLRYLVFGGEAIAAETIARARAACPDVRIINSYGPTEIADVCAEADVATVESPKFTTIGRPIGNTRLLVLDEHLQLAPIGVAGELYIGGVGVGRGYVGAAALTAERFLPDPFGEPGSRMYRSGDIVRWLPCGMLDFIGRSDHQVKVHGVRIELGELESRLMLYRGVAQAVVVCEEANGGDGRLVAFVTALPGTTLDIAQLRKHMQAGLPPYMVPAFIQQLKTMPLTASGKIDRLRLLKAASLPAAEAPSSSRTELEAGLAALWTDVTGGAVVGPRDNFFELGGSSLSVSRLVARVRSRFGVDLQIGDVFDRPCFDELACHVAQLMRTGAHVAVDHIVPRKARAGTTNRVREITDSQVAALLQKTQPGTRR